MRRLSAGLLSQICLLQDVQRSNRHPANLEIEILTTIADALVTMMLVLLAVLAATGSGAWWSDTWQTAGQASQKVTISVAHQCFLILVGN